MELVQRPSYYFMPTIREQQWSQYGLLVYVDMNLDFETYLRREIVQAISQWVTEWKLYIINKKTPCIEKDLLKTNLFVLLSTPLFYSGSKLLVGRKDVSVNYFYSNLSLIFM